MISQSRMRKRTLGRTDVKLSEVSLGTWGLASPAYGTRGPQQFQQTVERALEAGVSTFDMAPTWGDGESERLVGQWTRSRRDEVEYVTRCGAVQGEEGLVMRYDPAVLKKDCEASLSRLGTDRLDLLLLHNPDEETLRREDWREAMRSLKEEGKIRAWGVSAGDAGAAARAITAGAEALCIVYNLFLDSDLHDLSGELGVTGCGILARSPLAYGLLSGRWSAYRQFPEGDHRRDRWSEQALRARVEQVHGLRFLVHGNVPSMAAAAIRFVLSNALVTTAIVGARTAAQIATAADCSVEPPHLPEDDLAKLPRVLAKIGA